MAREQENFETDLRDYEVEVIASHVILVRNASSEDVAAEAGREAAANLGFSNIQVNVMQVLDTTFTKSRMDVEI